MNDLKFYRVSVQGVHIPKRARNEYFFSELVKNIHPTDFNHDHMIELSKIVLKNINKVKSAYMVVNEVEEIGNNLEVVKLLPILKIELEVSK